MSELAATPMRVDDADGDGNDDGPFSPCSFVSDTNEDLVSVIGQPLRPMDNSLGPSSRAAHDTHGRTALQNFLQTVPHLFTLNIDALSELEIMIREYGAMNIVIAEGSLVPYVFVVASGTVEVMNSKKGLKGKTLGHRRVGSITAPNLFGMDNAILETPSEFTYHASTQCTLLLIPKAQILQLFDKSPIFANSVSGAIVQTLPAFATFREFCRAIFGLSAHAKDSTHHGYRLSLPDITRIFKSGGTLLHRQGNDAALDLNALRYCIRRLPTNICETYILILASTLPDYVANEFLADAATKSNVGGGSGAGALIPVDSVKRRRCAWTFPSNSQTVVMMRDGYTDVVDLVSNLCIFNIEAKKLRTRMQQMVSPSAVELLREAMVSDQSVDDVLQRLTFSAAEATSLRETFGADALSRLYNIVLHREEYVVHMESGLTRRFFPDAYANWGITLKKQLKKRLKLPDDEELPENTVIDVIFSANRTFKNLFCSMAESLKAFVECAGHGDDCQATPWTNQDDRYYYILTKLLERDDTVREAYRAQLESNGFLLMEDAYASALIVDVLDVNALDVKEVDPEIRESVTRAKEANGSSAEQRPHFLINVDKTFGSQIELVVRSLLLTFGDRVRSVNLVGKAGGLSGNRGDIVLPSKLLFSKQSFGEDSTDEIRLCNKNSLNVEDLAALARRLKVQVLRGTSITIPGFLLQSETVLKFYKKVHGCTAVEMQSSYVARQIEECRRAAVLSRTATSRYLFYMDDMPFGNQDGSELTPKTRTIISTIYATTRVVLNRVLQA